MSVEGGTTKDPLVLYYRDTLECFEFLFGDPLFQDHMEYVPRCEFTTGEEPERLYNEIMTADMAWNLQVKMLFLRKSSKDTIFLTARKALSQGRHWA